jgi:hypothetical protein
MPSSSFKRFLYYTYMENVNLLNVSARLLYRKVTAGYRTLPQLYVLGAPKCGTTALYEIMRHHPNFAPPFYDIKELNFLQDIPDFNPYDYKGGVKVLFDFFFGAWKGARSYRKFFPLVSEMKAIEQKTGHHAITGDFSPITLYCPKAAERIRRMSPDARLIIMLRNPVDRIYSEYNMFFERTRMEPRSFEKAIEDELNHHTIHHFVIDTYLRRGIYEPYIRTYFQHFDRSQILIVRSEDFFSRTPEVFGDILEFLGLPKEGQDLAKKEVYKNETIYKTPIKEGTRKFLYDYYQPFNQSLYELIGMDMGWNENGSSL